MNNVMLQNFIENGSKCNFPEAKLSKPQRGNAQDLELLVGTAFNQVIQMIEEHDINLNIPEEAPKTSEKIEILKAIIAQLISHKERNSQEHSGFQDQSNLITCKDCQNYESNLQKLEQEVRQHIRLQQQLKIFQDSQEDKIEEYKKQKKNYDKKIDSLNRQLDDSKSLHNALSEKIQKLEQENEHYKKELKDIKRNVNTHEPPSTKRESHKHSAYSYQSKENKIDWVHRNISTKREEKDKHYDRKSIQKRGDSAEKNWRMSANQKSNKMISVMNDKLVQEKTKQERKKAIHSKFDYRR